MKPHIFVDGRVFDTTYQGTRTYIQNLYTFIDKFERFEIFLASNEPEKTALFFPNSNIHFISYTTKTNNKIARAFREIPDLINRYKIDIAHFQYVSPVIKNCKQIVTIHDILFKEFPNEFPLQYRIVKNITFYLSAKKADILTTVSDYSKQAIAHYFHLPLNNIHVIPNGVAEIYFQPYNELEAKKFILQKYNLENFILYVSRIEPRKNQAALITAYVELKLYNKKQKLVFIGKQDIKVPEITAILNNVSEEIKKNIYFLENIPDMDLLNFYRACDVFVYPSKAEGFGIPPLEAAALKKNVICSNATAMKDYSFFGSNHIHPTLTELKKALSHFNQSETVLENIQKAVHENYSWEKSAKTLSELIWKETKK